MTVRYRSVSHGHRTTEDHVRLLKQLASAVDNARRFPTDPPLPRCVVYAVASEFREPSICARFRNARNCSLPLAKDRLEHWLAHPLT
jgi:hypothetical protein